MPKTKMLQQNPSWNKARSLQVSSAVKCAGVFSPLLEVIFFLIINFNLGLIYAVWKLVNFLQVFSSSDQMVTVFNFFV